ncbi:MAG TPA: hypothetical protein VGP72_17580 [Planctomycetota bacterium]
MATKHNHPTHVENKIEARSKNAYAAMSDIRNALYRRYVDFLLAHEGRIRDEVGGEDSYSFTLQQIDEQFLNKLNILERALSELSRCEFREGQTTMTTYETVEVIARREELPQKVADVLAEHGDSDFLDLCVLKADEKQAEVLVVLAREESGPPASAAPAEQHRKHGEQGDQSDDQT